MKKIIIILSTLLFTCDAYALKVCRTNSEGQADLDPTIFTQNQNPWVEGERECVAISDEFNNNAAANQIKSWGLSFGIAGNSIAQNAQKNDTLRVMLGGFARTVIGDPIPDECGNGTTGHRMNIVQTTSESIYYRFCAIEPQKNISQACWSQEKGDRPVVPSFVRTLLFNKYFPDCFPAYESRSYMDVL